MSPVRTSADRCPGVLRLHEAADGFLARLRLPGGFVGAAALRALAAASAELGDGRLELTSRGNVQVRGLDAAAADEFTQRAFRAGLVPSVTHDEVRNVVASPLAGIDRPGDLHATVTALDAAIVADPALAGLTGRFLFGLDDGRGDIAVLGPDALAVLAADGATAHVEGVRVPVAEVPAALVAVAHAFLAERRAQDSAAWRIADLADGRARVRARLGATVGMPDLPAPEPLPVGPVARADGGLALVVAAPLGRLTAAQARWLADRADLADGAPVRVTPSRRVVLPFVSARTSADADAIGLVTDAASPWLGVSACAGRPRCASALADVQADAARSLQRWPGRRVHWSGCARRCGRGADVRVDVVATDHGYRIEDADARL